MDIEVNPKGTYTINSGDLDSRHLYECDNPFLPGPILVCRIGNIVSAILLGPEHRGMGYDISRDQGLREAKYRRFAGSVTLTER